MQTEISQLLKEQKEFRRNQPRDVQKLEESEIPGQSRTKSKTPLNQVNKNDFSAKKGLQIKKIKPVLDPLTEIKPRRGLMNANKQKDFEERDKKIRTSVAKSNASISDLKQDSGSNTVGLTSPTRNPA